MSNRPSRFVFADRSYDPASGEVQLHYRLDDVLFCERLVLPPCPQLSPLKAHAVEAALDALHWIAGVSYYKSYCPPEWGFEHQRPNAWQAKALDTIYRQGLAEFAWHQSLDVFDFPSFEAYQDHSDSELEGRIQATHLGLSQRVLLPLGGGKDSLVALDRLQVAVDSQDLISVQVGEHPVIHALGQYLVETQEVGQHVVIQRHIDPQLIVLNEQGAMNGHVPITAIHSAVLTLLAIVMDVHWVAFSNERSAEEPTLVDDRGRGVNHQWSKTLAFESLWDQWVGQYVAGDLRVFSVLRPDRELAIVRHFSGLTKFHPHFYSCNRNFHQHTASGHEPLWCGRCPKCHFVFLMMAVFLTPSELVAIFGRDYLADPECMEGFRALLALDEKKPFECVGEAKEARSAIAHLAQTDAWSAHAVVDSLARALGATESVDALLVCDGPHRLPEELAPCV